MSKTTSTPGKLIPVQAGESPAAAAGRADAALLKGAIAARLAGPPPRVVDLNWPLPQPGEIELIRLESEEGREIMRHSASHVMADAVQQLFPQAKVTIGPAIENGFYYDFDYPPGFTPEDLPKIEQKMQEIAEAKSPFRREEVSREEAIRLFEGMGEGYKVELIRELPEGETISLYRHGRFVDLCRGPHLPDTGWIKAFKLTAVAGAYWRGSERNPMLQRIYGTAFPDAKQMRIYLQRLEEAKKRDHRKLGRELDLFSVHEEIGPGFVVYHPKLGLVRSLLEEFEKHEHLRRGYSIVYGPMLLKSELWQRSGHYDHYKQNMYFTTVDEEEYGIKPMNCLSHMLIYKAQVRSYRDLPLRYFELGTVHRHEKSGVLSGLFRVRAFTQDDAHILCTPEQLEAEVVGVLHFVLQVMKLFGFEVEMEISTRPADSIGTDQDWERATQALTLALEHQGLPFRVCPGEGAFYGPKIDIKLKDALDRRWQCATIQCDFTLPERFELEYVGADGARHRPVMIHRVVLGSIERFLGILIEHFAGAFPVWLAPVQARLLPVTDRQHDFCRTVAERLRAAGIRVEEDFRNEKLNYKIREAETQKVPYMLVIGDREVAEDAVSPRTHGGDDWKAMKVEAFIARVKDSCRIPETELNP